MIERLVLGGRVRRPGRVAPAGGIGRPTARRRPRRISPDDAPPRSRRRRGRAAADRGAPGRGVVALPTDTVYGLAVGLDTPGGIERLFRVKHRPPEKGIVLLLDDAAQAALLGDMSPAADGPGGRAAGPAA